jgi:TolA-binding protein
VFSLILLAIAYSKVYKPKEEIAAQDMLFKAQYWFDQDSIAKSLNDPSNGFLAVADQYGSTKAGNLAKYYAGLTYYELGDFPNAEKYLAKFNPKYDEIIGGLAIAALADAQMENGDKNGALKNYKKAANFSDNEASAPFLLFKAGLACEHAGEAKDALTFFSKIESEFPNSNEAGEAKKYIAKVAAGM